MFYRIGLGCPLGLDDLAGPTFFSLAARTPAYGGVMAARVAQQQNGAPGRSAPRSGGTEPVREVPSTRGVLLTEFGDLVDHVQVSDG